MYSLPPVKYNKGVGRTIRRVLPMYHFDALLWIPHLGAMGSGALASVKSVPSLSKYAPEKIFYGKTERSHPKGGVDH